MPIATKFVVNGDTPFQAVTDNLIWHILNGYHVSSSCIINKICNTVLVKSYKNINNQTLSVPAEQLCHPASSVTCIK